MKNIVVFMLTEIIVLIVAIGIAFLLNGILIGRSVLELINVSKIPLDIITYAGMKYIILIIFLFLSLLNALLIFTKKQANLGMQRITPDIEIPVSAGKTLDSAKFLDNGKFKKAFNTYKYKRNSKLNKLYAEGLKTISKIDKMKMMDLLERGEKVD